MDPEELNLRQLRHELKRIGLSPSGLKQTLVKRLRTALEEDGKTTIAVENLKDIPSKKYIPKDSDNVPSRTPLNKRKTEHRPKIVLTVWPPKARAHVEANAE